MTEEDFIKKTWPDVTHEEIEVIKPFVLKLKGYCLINEPKKQPVEINGKLYTLKELLDSLKLDYSTLKIK